jgi:type IV pilus assembly protein PilM
MALRSFLTLDIGSSTLKLAEFASKGRGHLSLVNFGQTTIEAPIESASEEERYPHIATALQKLLRERSYRSSKIAISVSGQQVLTRFMNLPATDEAKVRQMVRYETAQNILFPIEEVVWDYQVVGTKADSEMEVLLVAIKNDILEGYKRIVSEANLDLQVTEVSPIAIANAMLYNYSDLPGSTLVLDIGARTTNIIFVEAKRIFIQSNYIAGNSIIQNVMQEFEISAKDAENLIRSQGFVGLGGAYEEPELESAAKLSKIIRNVMTRLHADVSRRINFYKAQHGGTAPKKMLLCGGASILPYADHFFKEKMEFEIEYLNPFRNVPLELPPDEIKKLEEVAHSMGEAVGLGLRMVTDCPIEINLVPPSAERHRQFLKRIPFFIASMAGALCIVMSLWLYHWKVVRILSDYRDSVSRDVAKLSENQMSCQEALKNESQAKTRAEQLKDVIQARYLWPHFFDDLNRRLPPEVWITLLSPEQKISDNSFKALSPAESAGGETPVRLAPRGIRINPAATASGPVTLPVITHFELRGQCLNDPKMANPYKPITQLETNLKDSPYFSEARIVEQSTTIQQEDWTFSFIIRVKLKDPISF